MPGLEPDKKEIREKREKRGEREKKVQRYSTRFMLLESLQTCFKDMYTR
jgi:hypothetical protein